jgi:FKBP12-rapamycin complex-associated protein
VAILWHELWHEGLEEASRLYFGERNVKGMFATLEPLHGLIEKGPQTLKETSFNQVGPIVSKTTGVQYMCLYLGETNI